MRVVGPCVAAAVAIVPSLAMAQSWGVQGGIAARGEYNDNYAFRPEGAEKQSAFTTTITPFITAIRRTEATDLTAVLGVGANWVSESSNEDFLSGRFGLDGSFRDARSTWTASASAVRSPKLQSELGPQGAFLSLLNTDTASVNGAYTYTLAERWSLGASAGVFGNRYDRLEDGGTELPDNRGYNIGGNVAFAFADRTRLTLSPLFSHSESDLTISDYVTTTLSIVHQFSPRFGVTVSVGDFRSEIETVDSGVLRRDNGVLYGASLSYAFSERTQLRASVAESLAPSSTGSLSASRIADSSIAHGFSDRLTGRIGVRYERTFTPEETSGSFTTNLYTGEVGVSYRLGELWRLDGGYRYVRGSYSNNPTEPRQNIAYVSIGYNWPGTSFTDWVGGRPDSSPFDRYTIP